MGVGGVHELRLRRQQLGTPDVNQNRRAIMSNADPRPTRVGRPPAQRIDWAMFAPPALDNDGRCLVCGKHHDDTDQARAERTTK